MDWRYATQQEKRSVQRSPRRPPKPAKPSKPPKSGKPGQGPKPMMYDPLSPLSPAAQQAIATRTAEASLVPVRAELERLRKESQGYYAARGKDIQGFGLAGAELLKPIAGQVQAGYAGAAGETASFAKGFADANTQLSASRGQGAEEVLAAAGPTGGAPAGQGLAIEQASGAGPSAGGPGGNLHDLIYGQGEIPAAGLAREGAAFGAAASFLPASMLGKTSFEMSRSAQEGQTKENDFMSQLSELEGKRPGLIENVLSDLRNNEIQKAATRINREYLKVKKDKVKLDAKTLAYNQGLDSSKVNEQLSAGNGYLTNDYGEPILSNGQPVPYSKFVAPPKPPKPGSGPGAKRAKALQDKREKMFADASGWMVTGKDTNTASLTYGQQVTKPKYTYTEAKQILWNKYGAALMGYAAQGGKAAMKKQVNQMINAALAQIGLKPKSPPRRGGKNAGRPGPR